MCLSTLTVVYLVMAETKLPSQLVNPLGTAQIFSPKTPSLPKTSIIPTSISDPLGTSKIFPKNVTNVPIPSNPVTVHQVMPNVYSGIAFPSTIASQNGVINPSTGMVYYPTPNAPWIPPRMIQNNSNWQWNPDFINYTSQTGYNRALANAEYAASIPPRPAPTFNGSFQPDPLPGAGYDYSMLQYPVYSMGETNYNPYWYMTMGFNSEPSWTDLEKGSSPKQTWYNSAPKNNYYYKKPRYYY